MMHVYEAETYVYDSFQLNTFERYCVQSVFRHEVYGTWIENPEEDIKEVLTIRDVLEGFEQDLSVEQVWHCFDKDSTLMRYFFYTNQEQSLLCRKLRLRQRMTELLLGHPSPVYTDYAQWLEREDFSKEESVNKSLHIDNTVTRQLLSIVTAKTPPKQLIGLYGPEGSGRAYGVRCLYKILEAPLYFLDARVFTGEEEKDRRIVDDVLCECIFFHAGLMLCHLDEASVSKALFHRMFSVLPIIFAKANQKLLYVEESCGFSSVWLEMKALSYGEALQLWQQAALDYAPRLVDSQMLREMPNKFVLTPGQIRQAAALAAQKGRAVGAEVSAKDLYEACHELLSVYMGKKVQRITPSYQWQDLVLPAFQKQMLQVACDQVRYRHQVYETWGFEHKMTYGRGISMVFSGLPGTGKTMAAQVIASELGMDLYKVELAAVVSKYIGETEKNLEEIFEQAAASQVILFFDEADVMFSKRTEVRDSNDRYSNMEAAYMLQRIESYEGIVILSTNYIQNFDEAFKRRMKMIVDFPFPDANQRYQIWKKVFPKELPLEQEVDLEYLSHQFEFSGSNIKNVALYASFLAASQKERVTMKHLIDGVKNEYAKIGKQLQPQDMGEYFMLW